jgi:hypothetical protein
LSQLQFRKIVLPDAPVKLTPIVKVPERELTPAEVASADAPTPADESNVPVRCPDGLSPEGETCPRCGGHRAPSGIDGGTWVHFTPPVAVAPAGNYASLTPKFLLAGKAVFTIANNKGDHYTFKVRRVESEYPANSGKQSVTYFVSVKSSGGTWPYRYIGLLNKDTGAIRCTPKSEFVTGTKEYNVAAWACATVIGHKLLPDGYKIEHAGQCGKCGKTLTDPLSIERGIGPDCWETL